MDPISVMDMDLVYLRTTRLERLGRAHLLYHMREKVGAGVVRVWNWGGWVDLDASAYRTERVRSLRFGKSRWFRFLLVYCSIVSQS